jgi:O-antigen/teichoic acid export membrane protein
MKELVVFYGGLSIAGMMALGYTLYVYRKHQHSRKRRIERQDAALKQLL